MVKVNDAFLTFNVIPVDAPENHYTDGGIVRYDLLGVLDEVETQRNTYQACSSLL